MKTLFGSQFPEKWSEINSRFGFYDTQVNLDLQFFTRLYEEVRDAQSLEQVMERGLQFAHRALAEHEVLQKVLQTEPDVLLPKLTVESTRILGIIGEFLIPYLDQHGLAEGVDPREASDFLARMILSYMNAPGRWDLDDPVQVAALVRTELLAGIVAGPEPIRSPR